MLIIVYGDDSFRVREKVNFLKDAFAKKFDPTGLNTAVFPPGDGSALVPGEVLQAACSFPFLSEKRLVVVRDLISAAKKDDVDFWAAGFARLPISSIVILWETDDLMAVEKNPLFKKLKGLSEVHAYPFPALSGAALLAWVQQRVAAQSGQIEPLAARALIERVASDLWQLTGEIAKLVALAAGSPITKTMVEENVAASFAGEIFALVDAVARREPAAALCLLQQERSSGANDFYLLTMLARQVRILLAARSLLDQNPRADKSSLAAEFGLHPFVAQKALEQARAFTFADLKKTHDLLFELDWKMKSGQVDPTLAVDLVTVSLLK